MAAATEARNTRRRAARARSLVVNSGVTIPAGTLVTALTASGLAVTAGTASAGIALGVAVDTVVGDGVKRVELECAEAFHFANSTSTDAIGVGDIGATCYIVDNQTVAKTDSSGTRKAAGRVFDVDAQGVWVVVG